MQSLNLLSRPQAAGRVALYFRPGVISRLHVGVPEPYATTLQQMSSDFNFSLQPADPDLALPAPEPLAPAEALPWERPFVAHIVDGLAFAKTLAEAPAKGQYLPAVPNDGHVEPTWRLPDAPPSGLTLQPSWNGQGPPGQLVAPNGDEQHWPLGWAHDGMQLQSSGRINVYGRREAVAEWLVNLVLKSLTAEPAGLIVVDGAGDLVPRLKRKQQVTRLLGRQLTYIDIDGAAVAGGFNPLAPMPGESEADTLGRWQQWFAGMGLHPQSLPLLGRARAEGVGDVPSLQRWLGRPEQQQQIAAASLTLALKRLLADPLAHEWLSWPTDCFAGLQEGALFFACRAEGWAGTQLLQSVLLAAVPGGRWRVVAHGTPWKEMGIGSLRDLPRLVIGNGPLLPDSTVILTHMSGPGAQKLTARFLTHDAQQEENLQLLQNGEVIIVHNGIALPVTWQAVSWLNAGDSIE
jgi:hypothetical protein